LRIDKIIYQFVTQKFNIFIFIDHNGSRENNNKFYNNNTENGTT